MWKIYAPDVCLSRDLPQESVRYQRQPPTSEENKKMVSDIQKVGVCSTINTIKSEGSELISTNHHKETNRCQKIRLLPIISKPQLKKLKFTAISLNLYRCVLNWG